MEKTVRKAFAILELLAAQPGGHRVTDIANGVGLTKPNVHRLLATLVELGYAERDEATSRYRASLKVWQLGRALVEQDDLQATARPVLVALSQRAGESATLGIFDGGDMVFVAQVECPHAIRAVARIGSRIPATASSVGKAMLAWLPAEALGEAMLKLRAFTPRTLTERSSIERDLRLARSRGYALSRGEFAEGVAGMASPVFDAGGEVVAAVGLWGSEQAIVGSRHEALAALVVEAAAEVSRRLGYVAPRESREVSASAKASRPARPKASARAPRGVPQARRGPRASRSPGGA